MRWVCWVSWLLAALAQPAHRTGGRSRPRPKSSGGPTGAVGLDDIETAYFYPLPDVGNLSWRQRKLVAALAVNRTCRRALRRGEQLEAEATFWQFSQSGGTARNSSFRREDLFESNGGLVSLFNEGMALSTSRVTARLYRLRSARRKTCLPRKWRSPLRAEGIAWRWKGSIEYNPVFDKYLYGVAPLFGLKNSAGKRQPNHLRGARRSRLQGRAVDQRGQ